MIATVVHVVGVIMIEGLDKIAAIVVRSVRAVKARDRNETLVISRVSRAKVAGNIATVH